MAEDTVAQAEFCLGWHVHVANQPSEQLSLQQGVPALVVCVLEKLTQRF